MTTAPGGELAAPGHKLHSASPQPATAGAAVPPQQPRPAVVTLPGEIDTSNDCQVRGTLTRALDNGTAVLIADAGKTTFCGCSAVTALLLTHHRAAAAGAQLRVVVGKPAMWRILQLTAADQVLNIYPTLAAALADGQTPDRSLLITRVPPNAVDQAARGLAAPQLAATTPQYCKAATPPGQ